MQVLVVLAELEQEGCLVCQECQGCQECQVLELELACQEQVVLVVHDQDQFK